MPKVVSLINLKGGVAKTTTTIQIADCLSAQYGKKVLVIDLDPQTNAAIALIDETKWEALDEQKQTLYHLFDDKLNKTNHFDVNRAIQKGVSNLWASTLDLLASSIKFIDIQDRMSEVSNKTGFAITPMEVLKSAIHAKLDEYQYVLIDCPPNLGFITRNGIEISDYYLIPSIPDTLSTYGIPQIISQIQGFSNERPLKIRCLGLVITKFSSNSDAHKRGKRSLPTRFAKIFQDLGLPEAPVFETVMPQANATSDAMEITSTRRGFKQKYGTSDSGGRYLHEYVTELTREFLKYVG